MVTWLIIKMSYWEILFNLLWFFIEIFSLTFYLSDTILGHINFSISDFFASHKKESFYDFTFFSLEILDTQLSEIT